jgi:hypothetical protein
MICFSSILQLVNLINIFEEDTNGNPIDNWFGCGCCFVVGTASTTTEDYICTCGCGGATEGVGVFMVDGCRGADIGSDGGNEWLRDSRQKCLFKSEFCRCDV